MSGFRQSALAGVLVLVITVAAVVAFRWSAEPLTASALRLAALATAVAAAVLLPGPLPGLVRGASHAFAGAAGGMAACLLLAPVPPPVATAAFAGLWALLFFATCLKAAAAAAAPTREAAAIMTFLVIAAAGGAPVWLGTLAEASGHQAVADVIVAVSPLTFLAGLISYDYLHDGWFYAHSAMGYLRFRYPDPWLSALVLVALGSILGMAARGIGRD